MARILIVEDDSKTAHSISHGLRAHGHVCAVRPNAESVLEFTRKERPDLILLDVMIPGMSGFELCRQIRRDDEIYKVPILIVSAMCGEEEVKHGLAQGADDYIPKPVNMNALVQRVNALLQSNAGGADVDELTRLSDAESSRRELQRRITRGETFGLVYVEMLHLREFSRKAGAGGRDKALRHLARALTQAGEKLKDRSFFAGHLGSGYFLCIMPPSRAHSFCEIIREAWANHLGNLYESVGLTMAGANNATGNPLELLFCITTYEKQDRTSAKELLEVVSRIRSTSVKRGGGGIYIDRRVGRDFG